MSARLEGGAPLGGASRVTAAEDHGQGAPGLEPPLERARSLAALVAEHAGEGDIRRELSPEVAGALADAGLFRLLVPRSAGGEELDPPTYIRVVETIAIADGSTAWCVNQGAVFATNAAFLAPEITGEIWGDRRAAIANGPSPTARADVVDGGYRLSGRWAFSSGFGHATWLAGLAFVHENGERRLRPDGRPEVRHLLLRKGHATQIDDWDVAGLRATGSHQFEVTDSFVPEAYSVWTYGDPARESGPLYLYPMMLLFASGFASVALGVARGAVDALIDFAGGKLPRGAAHVLRDYALVQTEVGKAEADLRAARAYLHSTVGEVWEEVVEAHAITLDQRARLRLAATHAIRMAGGVVDRAYAVYGAEAIHASSPIQRRFQDIHVITQHLQGRLAHYESMGRHLLGLEPDLQWL